MTLPTPVLKRVSLLITRRTHEGCFHFSPDPVVNRCIEFALAYAANKYEMQLYAHISLSNHGHTTLFDPHGKQPQFRAEFHSLVTRSVNVHRGTREAKWSPDRQNPVILCDAEAVLDRNGYLLSNAARHDLVDDPTEWPGVLTKIDEIGGPPRLIRRPSHFYDPKGELPEVVELRFVKPVELADWTIEEYRQELRRRVAEYAQRAREERRRKKRTVVGRTAILEQDFREKAASQPKVAERNPRVACRLATLRVAVLQWLSRFRLEHRRCRELFESGDRSVEFPCGTYWHVLRYGVNCSAVGPPAPLAVA